MRDKHCPAAVFFASLALMSAAVLSAQPTTSLAGLETPAVVIYDDDGAPHICAGSRRDTNFMLGYVHAQDRFFQMDVLRRSFRGELAELLGPARLLQDLQFRTLGLSRAAEASWEAYQAAEFSELRENLEAYADGVNAYMSSHGLPTEYTQLELSQVAPWSALDTVLASKGLAFTFSFDLSDMDRSSQLAAYIAAGELAGFDGAALFFEDTNRSAPFDPTVSIPQADALNKAVSGSKLKAPSIHAVQLAREYIKEIEDIPLLSRTLRRDETPPGSNWWVLSGAVSESGFPMLANDPHLALNAPATFYEVHLVVPESGTCPQNGESEFRFQPPDQGEAPALANDELNATGVTFPGVPAIVVGCTAQICWGSTVNPMDVTDVYAETILTDSETGLPTHTIFEGEPEPMVIVDKTFRVNNLGDGMQDNLSVVPFPPGIGSQTFIIPRRNNGPMLTADLDAKTALSIQYAGWGATFELEAFRRFLQADSPQEFAAALQFFDVGSQNFSYADVNGNIAYFTSGELPLREDLQTMGSADGGTPPYLLRDGTHTLKHEWLALSNPQENQSLAYEILPFAEMPQVQNPARGFILSANNDPIGTTLDNDPVNELRPGGGIRYLNSDYFSLRAGRIEGLLDDLLQGGNRASIDDLKAIQANNQMLDAELMVPFLLTASANGSAPSAPQALSDLAANPGVAEAITRLQSWDFSTPTGLSEGFDPGDDPNQLPPPEAQEIANSVAATIWAAFRGQAVQSIIDETLTGLGLANALPPSPDAYKALAHLLQNFGAAQGVGASGVDFFLSAGVDPSLSPAERRDWLLLNALQRALALLASDTLAPAFQNSADQDDYRWGRLHRLELDHFLGGNMSIPPGGGFSHVGPLLPGVARSGGYEVVDASNHSARAREIPFFRFSSGAATRMVALLDPDGIEAEGILPGGQSGVPGDPHYSDQLGRWLTHGYHPLPLDLDQVVAERTERFEPTCAEDAETPTLCLNQERFRLTVNWRDFQGNTGAGQVVPIPGDIPADDSGLFFFFDAENWEMLVKVLNGCPITDHFWVFAAATTNVEFTLQVTDTSTGDTKSYFNPLGNRADAITDTRAFATCGASSLAPTVAPEEARVTPAESSVVPWSSVSLPGALKDVSVPSDLARQAVCSDTSTAVCLNEGRFRVEVEFEDFQGNVGSGRVVDFRSKDSGLFYFFAEDNWEMLVKVLDACNTSFNRYWVFFAATTNVKFTLRVTDTDTAVVKEYSNPLGQDAETVLDTGAFATCP